MGRRGLSAFVIATNSAGLIPCVSIMNASYVRLIPAGKAHFAHFPIFIVAI
jgi:hypothetical protein